MIMLVNTTPDRIPADVVAEEQDAALEKMGHLKVSNQSPFDAPV